MALNLILALVALGILLVLLRKRQSYVPKGIKLPPGPPGKPVVGNLLDLPPRHSWLKFKEWSDQYGPVFRLNLVGQDHIVLSTEKVANELLRERGNIYSSREQSPAAVQLLGGNLRPLFLPHNEVWRRGRRVMHQCTMTTEAPKYEPAITLESTLMLSNLIKSPEHNEDVFNRYSSGMVFRLAFGRKLLEENDPYLPRVLKVLYHLERIASPGAYMVDMFPILMHVPTPLAPFKQELNQLRAEELGLFRELLNETRDRMKKGTAPDCWERTFLEKQEEFGLTDDEGAYAVGTLYEAGSGTTAMALMSFNLAMVLHPEWQEKAQREVDDVVGSERLPEFSDIPQLPTVRAVTKETLRWRPVTAGGVPHKLERDDVYNGLFLPKGSIIHANQWAIHREPELYPDPEIYNPERWLSPKYPTFREPLTKYPNLQNFSSFGFGRRICPGQNIAERALHLATARIAWGCHITKAKGQVGKEDEIPLYDYTEGFNVQPRPFPFELKVRNAEKMAVLRQTVDLAVKNDPLGS